MVATNPTTRKRRRSAKPPTTPTMVAVVEPSREAAGPPTAVVGKSVWGERVGVEVVKMVMTRSGKKGRGKG